MLYSFCMSSNAISKINRKRYLIGIDFFSMLVFLVLCLVYVVTRIYVISH